MVFRPRTETVGVLRLFHAPPHPTMSRNKALPIGANKAEAKALGLPKYHGSPCKRAGHTVRYTGNNLCVLCEQARTRADRAAHPEKYRAWHDKWRKANPDKAAALNAKNTANQRAPGCIPEGFDLDATVPFYARARHLTRTTATEWCHRRF